MAGGKEVAKEVEWRIKVEEDGTLERRVVGCMWEITAGLALRLCKFVKKAWELGVNDPRKFIHCLKVGIALSAVSLFYYWKPLYDGVGGNAMWAVMTVIVVFEYTAGATICKTVNRICGTFLAGFLGIGVHWVASKAGDQYEPIITGLSLFILASAATFSRFIPTIKARFDYGAMIFILTFSLVSVSGYRVDELLALAQYRMFTIIAGSILCIIVSVIIRPIWAGQELYVLVTGNLDKLANSLQCCVVQYFACSAPEAESDDECSKKLLGYKCVLSSKATEETMANLARWEPAHGRFNFRHPWKQYVKIGASMRSCASCIDALIGCINSDNKASDEMKKTMSSISMKVGGKCASVIRELASTIRNTKKSSKLDILVTEMNSAAQELRSLLNSYPNLVNPTSHDAKRTPDDVAAKIEIPLMEIIQVVTVASLLNEIVARVEGIVEAVEELSDLAEFKPEMCVKSKQQHSADSKISPEQQNDDKEAENTPNGLNEDMNI
ncbi:LOW QUALITY PROTEIN: aluminum-activated malate transporter 10-like [Cajanus cajan]|uniref:LOW QUALITY PROTEIN: aluminum-activated malate transporter 10-like n=1 Tax=Cajanus cajan TaxID=3821 RepID=UPI00098DA6C2|nr:LOW QUALITY PROTEIN: aluminum-activated malate transporter 10-like [Cajanus cajan]